MSAVTIPVTHKKLQCALFGTVGLAALPHYQHLSLLPYGFFMILLAWRFAGILRPEWLPRHPFMPALLVMGLILLGIDRQGFLGRDAGSSLFIIALGLKLMEMKREHDIYLIIYMTFVMAATQFLYEQSIFCGAYIGIVCLLLIGLLAAVNGLKFDLVRPLRQAAVLLMQAAPLAATLFLLFPRLEPPQWMAVTSETRNRTGLSDMMEPGSITNLGLSDELVFRARFEGRLPPAWQRYWRGPVFAATDGKRWLQAPGLENYSKRNPKTSGEPYVYSLLMEPQSRNWVYALDMATGYSAPLSRNANYQLTTSESAARRSTYKVVSYPVYNTGSIAQAEHRDATQLPGPPSSRVRALVRQLRGDAGAGPPEAFIRNLLNHFRREKFRYTLEPPTLDDNPIESFLFDTRAGFCSHYASAFVYLLRVAGIPARVVTGYQGGETNELGNFIQVRQADAHAWAEVWLEHRGWVRFDPTAAVAPERIEYPLDVSRLSPGESVYFKSDSELLRASGLFKQAGLLWDNMDYNWQRWIINYHSQHQASFLAGLGIRDVWAMLNWLSALLIGTTAVFSLLILSPKRRPIDPALRAYQRFCGKLAARGLVRAPGEGARDFAERVKKALPERTAEIETITGLLIGLRYGRSPKPEDLTRLKREVDAFRP